MQCASSREEPLDVPAARVEPLDVLGGEKKEQSPTHPKSPTGPEYVMHQGSVIIDNLNV